MKPPDVPRVVQEMRESVTSTRPGVRRRARFPLSGRLITAILLLATQGCGDPDDPNVPDIQQIDSAGIEIVIASGGYVQALPERSIPSKPVLSVGGEQYAEYPLSRITGGLLLPDGRIAVVDAVTDQVAVFDSSGTLLRHLGRRGEGPGELQNAAGLRRRAADELVVWDDSNGRLIVFDTLGESRETLQTPPVRTVQRGMPFPGFLSDSFPIFSRIPVPGDWERFEGLKREEFIVDRYSTAAEFDVALAETPGQQLFGWDVGHARGAFTVLLSGVPRLASGGGRAFLGHGERFALYVWSTSGLERITRVDQARELPSPSELIAIRDSVIARSLRGPYGGGYGLSTAEIPVADSFPSFDDLLVSSSGSAWVREGSAWNRSAQRYLVFDSLGMPTAWVRLPLGFEVLDVADDRVLVTNRDELDVPSLMVYGIESPASAPDQPGR